MRVKEDTTSAQQAQEDNVTVAVFDMAVVRYQVPEWNALPRAAQRQHLIDRTAGPKRVDTTSNATTTGLHEVTAELLSLNAGQGGDIDEIDMLLLGDDDSSFSSSDTSLNNKVGEIQATDQSATGATFEVNEFLSPNQLNGETIAELALQTASGRLCNHAPTTQSYSKDSQIAILFNIEITMSDT